MQQDLVVAIKLKGIKPCVTRQVQVSSNLGLDRFHQLMQVVMGWENTAPHLWSRDGIMTSGDPRQFVPPGPARRAQGFSGGSVYYGGRGCNLCV